ncbi:MAG: DUF2905 domain-containing protein [Anaerolineae bacterium]|nr:DUF2905 domain-containing protein [Thermoflexales bacterium]MDW8407044.1 DUF2905 domain-containing protein [Anaerolineae bacterium]
METIGRGLMIIGAIVLITGAALYLAGRLNLPLGQLPGDIRIERDNFRLYIPLATGLLISLLLTVLVNLIGRLWK